MAESATLRLLPELVWGSVIYYLTLYDLPTFVFASFNVKTLVGECHTIAYFYTPLKEVGT